MKKSRKLAWVVMGVVVLAAIGFFVWLSSLYSSWEPTTERVLSLGRIHFYHAKVRHQRFSWLPGPDLELVVDEIKLIVELSPCK